MKRKLSVVLSILLSITFIPFGMFTMTAGAATYGDYRYTVSDGKVTIREYLGTDSEVEIPDQIQGYPVVKIGEAFVNNEYVVKVVVPEGVTEIASYAFACSCLFEIDLPETLVEIGVEAFFNTWVEELYLPSSVKKIGKGAFSAIFGGMHTLWYGGTESQKSQIAIEDENYDIVSAKWYYESSDVLRYGKFAYRTVSDGVVIVNSGEVFSKKVIIPDVLSGEKVIAIGNAAFFEQENITEVIIPDTVKVISDHAFCYCTKMKKVTFGKELQEIGMSAFNGCYNLTSVLLPDKTKEIKDNAFHICEKIKTVTIPKSLKKIGYSAFYGCDEITSVLYKGTKTDKKKISVDSNNSWLMEGATWYYNVCDTHKYSNSCDNTCNVCKAPRTIKHSYKTTITEATLKKNGKMVKKCTACGKIANSSTIRHAETFELSKTVYTYNGKKKTPSVTVKDTAGKTLKENVDYTVSYDSGRKNVGSYKVTIKMIGNHKGTKTLKFKINPVKTNITELSSAKKKIVVKIAKKTTQVTGYQIQYSTSKKFTKAKTKTITNNKTIKTTLDALASNKTYYIKVRTYKTVNGTKYYSGWSSYKSVKTK